MNSNEIINSIIKPFVVEQPYEVPGEFYMSSSSNTNQRIMMTEEKALEAFKNLYNDIDKDNHLFVGTINLEMIKVAINCIEQVIRLDNIMRC